MSTTYVVLLPGDEHLWEEASEERRRTVYAKHEEFSKALAARGHTVTGGAELSPSRESKLVRTVDGAARVTDGPYAETVEQLTGFYLVQSDDFDDLVECVAILTESAEDCVEIRATTGTEQ